MSIEYSNRVWAHSKQQGTKLILLLALADMTNEKDLYCWPSLETLQQRARLANRQNVIRSLADIEKDREVWIERSRGRNHSNAYVVTTGMSADELAKILITKFQYAPEDAIQKANEFIENVSPGTHFKQEENVSSERENVSSERENVSSELTKCVPGDTLIRRNHNRTIIESEARASEDQPAAQPPAPTPATDFHFVEEDPQQALPRQFDPRQLAGGLWPKDTGQTPYEIYREAFATVPSRYQIQHMNGNVKDMVRWREITQQCALKGFRSYDNVFDVYQNGFRKGQNSNGNRTQQPTTNTTAAILAQRPELAIYADFQ